MNTTSCLIGNSSSGIREGEFIGTPVVNIGSRQNLRHRGDNVIDVEYKKDNILKAIEDQIQKINMIQKYFTEMEMLEKNFETTI